jgi:type II secretion system protein G
MNKKGFTLIELLIVVAIIGIVAAIAIPNLLTALQKGKQKATMGDIKTVGTALGAYMTAMSFCPQTEHMAGLLYLEPHFTKRVPRVDGWNYTWYYEYSGSGGDSYSLASGGKGGDFTSGMGQAPNFYLSITMSDFEKDIIFSDGVFMVGPKVKK